MQPLNRLYIDNPYLLRRKGNKQRNAPSARVPRARARSFVMPYGQYQGYYLVAVMKHDPSYIHWLYQHLKKSDTESAYDGGVRVTNAIEALVNKEGRRENAGTN